jgi:hypothetical protein
MRHMREILRLSLEAGLSTRAIGERAGVGATTVRDMLKRFARSGLNWPVPAEMSDADLEACVYGLTGVRPGRRKQPETGLAGGGTRAEAQACDAAGSVGRVYRGAAGWLSLQPLV